MISGEKSFLPPLNNKQAFQIFNKCSFNLHLVESDLQSPMANQKRCFMK